MKQIRSLLTGATARTLVIASLFASLPAHVAHANSYASCLTNTGGTVSFRLNDAADSVKVVGNAGALTINLGPLPRGLTVTNLNTVFGLLDGTFSVTCAKVGTGVPSLIGSSVAFNSPRGVAVNMNPASPRFGRVYVANSASGTKGDGLFAFGSDLSDTFGQGATARNGGITNFAAGGTSSPMRVKVGHDDDMLYVTDWADATGGLYRSDPDITNSTSMTYVLRKIEPNLYGTNNAVIPVGPNNNHGSIIGVETTGKLADGTLKLWTIDEDYQTDTSAPGLSEMNSLWEYDITATSLPWSNAPNPKLFTPTIGFASQTMDMARGTNGYFYITELRSAGNEAGLFVVDSVGTLLFNSRSASIAAGFTVDVINNSQGVAVSEDLKYCAVIQINNLVTIFPLIDGVPDFANRFNSGTILGTTGNGRGIAFDRADNLYIVSSGLGILQSMSIGFTATNTTTSDGLFTQAVPSVAVNATLLDPDTTVTNLLSEADVSVFATINIVRTNDDFSGPLGVNFTLTGTATRGSQVTNDYHIMTNGVVITNATTVFIPAGQSNVLVNIVAHDDIIPELTETAIFTLAGGPYNVIVPVGGTVSIIDNDTNMIDITAVTFAQCFEANTNDIVRYTLTRRGDTNAPSFDVNIKYAGSAISNVDYIAVTNVTFDPGQITRVLDVHPIDDAIVETNETIIASIAPGSAYLVGTNNALTAGATAIIVDDDQQAETVIFSDNFNTDTTANWGQLFAAEPNEEYDATVVFNYDYSALGIPPAPHSLPPYGSGDTLGLSLTVNKDPINAAAAGVNLYPTNLPLNLSGNYALRFDMYLMQNGTTFTTEYAMFGINHDGAHTNWFRNSGAGVLPGWTYDGVWAYVEADGAALGDYLLNSAPITAVAPLGPTALASRLASTLTAVFHQPPYTSGSGAGAPGNSPTTTTPSWTEVELSQIRNIVSLKINNTTIFSYSNATPFRSGNIMLGYNDAYDSIGLGGGGLVIYDNVRVVSLPSGIVITNVAKVGATAQLDFTWFENDPASAFKLQSASVVTGPYADDNNAATTYSVNVPGASYHISTPATNSLRFFRVRHL